MEFEAWLSHACGPGGARVMLEEIARDLAGMAAHPSADDTVRDAFYRGMLRFERLADRVVGRATGDVVEAARDPAGSSAREVTTWITVEMVDEVGAFVPGLRYEIELPDRSLRVGTLNAAGALHLDGIAAGECILRFPDLDADAWTRDGATPPRTARGDEGGVRTVRQGDTTESLAASVGLFWQTLWEHPRNAALRGRRSSHNILLPGDTIFVPEKLSRRETCATTRVHRFRRRGVPTELRVRCLDEEQQPYALAPFRLLGEGIDLHGALDGDGWLRVPIPPGARRLHLLLGEAGELDEFDLDVGSLDPHDEATGVCDRLRNLGYYAGPSTTGSTPALRDAIRWFQRDEGIEPTGEIDAALRDALQSRHRA